MGKKTPPNPVKRMQEMHGTRVPTSWYVLWYSRLFIRNERGQWKTPVLPKNPTPNERQKESRLDLPF